MAAATELAGEGGTEQARRLAVAVTASIASNCPSGERDAHGSKAAMMIGALASEDRACNGDALAYAGQMADELYSRSVVCRNRHMCGIHELCERIIELLGEATT